MNAELPSTARGNEPVPPYQVLWAKTDRDRSTGVTHPLICHLIDVASVAHVLWRAVLADGIRSHLADAIGLDVELAGTAITFWVGLHDLGKASPAFQRLHKPARSSLESAGLSFPRVFVREPNRHGIISAHVLPDLLVEHCKLSLGWARKIARAVGGHHGAWATPGQLQKLSSRQVGGSEWDAVRLDLLSELIRIFPCPEVHPQATDAAQNTLLMLLSGLTSVADWIGSMERYFPFAQVPLDTRAYAALARERATRALTERGWLAWKPPGQEGSFLELFGLDQPWPMQEAVIEGAKHLTPPALLIVEAPTGTGKTEAGLYAADHWARVGRQSGMYVAMPTMATSNAMFDRVRKVLVRRYPDRLVNLHLVHSHASLREDVRALQLATVDELAARDNESGGRVAAMTWFLPRKRTLLASFGVGTVDQALLSVLQTRHFFVRLFGLAHKTVIFDEVHAYDTYMSTLLQRLLRWLRAVGTSVVILSATLPASTRRELVRAYMGSLKTDLPEAHYPALTWASGGEIGVVPLRGPSSYRVVLEWIAQEPQAVAACLADALREGGCAAVICNTVRRAQQVYEAIKEAAFVPSEDLLLFHGRFPFAWRKGIEETVLNRFGKESTGTRSGVVVATQVIEQSLDLDFDLMVSDLAPVDLLIQRAGRLHRHERGARPGPVSSRRLLLCTPDESGGVPDFGSDAYVYDRYVLLKSWLVLQGRKHLTLPCDTETLIESVYGEPDVAPQEVGERMARGLARARQQMDERYREHIGKAYSCLVPAPDDEGLLSARNPMLDEDNPELHEAFRALTRLGRLGVDLVCLHETDCGLTLEPDGSGRVVDLDEEPDEELVRLMAEYKVSVTHYSAVRHFLEQEVPRGWRKCPSLRYARAAMFRRGEYRLDGTPFVLHLSRERGLEIEKEAE